MNSLRRAFAMIADGNNHGTLVAHGVLHTPQKHRYAVIAIGGGDFILETWLDKSPVRVSDAVGISDRCVLNVVNNQSAIWLPDYVRKDDPNWESREPLRHSNQRPVRRAMAAVVNAIKPASKPTPAVSAAPPLPQPNPNPEAPNGSIC